MESPNTSSTTNINVPESDTYFPSTLYPHLCNGMILSTTQNVVKSEQSA